MAGGRQEFKDYHFSAMYTRHSNFVRKPVPTEIRPTPTPHSNKELKNMITTSKPAYKTIWVEEGYFPLTLVQNSEEEDADLEGPVMG